MLIALDSDIAGAAAKRANLRARRRRAVGAIAQRVVKDVAHLVQAILQFGLGHIVFRFNTPEASQEVLAAAIGDALDVLEGNAPEDDTDADDSVDDTDLG